MWLVYLLRLSAPLGDPLRKRASALYYIGMTSDLEQRLRQHRAGQRGRHGAALTAAAVERGIALELARVWEGFPDAQSARAFEKHLKRNGHYHRLDPQRRTAA